METLFKNKKTEIGIDGDFFYISHVNDTNSIIKLRLSIEEFINRIGNAYYCEHEYIFASLDNNSDQAVAECRKCKHRP